MEMDSFWHNCLHSGNTNEQITLQPLEKKILKDFNLSKFILCTDGGLSSLSNRKYNTRGERAFITTQSLKKLKAHLKDWALSPAGWKIPNCNKEYDLTQINSLTPEPPIHHLSINQTFYKDRWIKNGFAASHSYLFLKIQKATSNVSENSRYNELPKQLMSTGLLKEVQMLMIINGSLRKLKSLKTEK